MDKVGKTRQASMRMATGFTRAFDDKRNIGRDVSQQLVWWWRVLGRSCAFARQLGWSNGGHNVIMLQEVRKKIKYNGGENGYEKWPHLDK